jgi:hypothetical protein
MVVAASRRRRARSGRAPRSSKIRSSGGLEAVSSNMNWKASRVRSISQTRWMRAVSPPLYAECTQPWFTKYIAPAGKWVHFVSAHDDANSMVDEIDPGQSFLRVNVLRWREIFRMIETSSSNVDLIGPFVVLICQGRSTATAKRPPRSRLRPKSRWRSFHELELRMFHRNPGYCLSSSGSPAVLTMTIRPDTDLGRRAETHLATITATGNFILFHASHRKLGHV